MEMKILNPQQTSSKVLAPGKTPPSISGIMSETMNKAHQLTMIAPAIPTEYVRKLMKTERVKSANIGLVRDIKMHLGRAVIYKDCKESNNLAQLGTLIANFRRGRHDLTKIFKKEESCLLSKQLPIIINKQRTFNIKIPLDNTGRAIKLKEKIKETTDIDMTTTTNLIEVNTGSARYHENLNLCQANAIRIYKVDCLKCKSPCNCRYKNFFGHQLTQQIRATNTRGNRRRRQQLQIEEEERDGIF